MLVIPTLAVPSQALSVNLAGQPCQVSIAALSSGLFLSLAVNNAPVVTTVLCHDRVRLVRGEYLGFIGDLAFYDTASADDPEVAGLGTRWLLVYLEAGEL